MVALSHRCSRSITRASLLPARGVDVFACSSTVSGREALVASGTGCVCGEFALLGRLSRSVVALSDQIFEPPLAVVA